MSDSLRPHKPQHARPPVHHQLLESTQTHVHWVGDAIQPSHPLSSPSPTALSQHQGLFKWVISSHQVDNLQVLEFQLQHQSFQWIFRSDFHLDGLIGSPCSPRDSNTRAGEDGDNRGCDGWIASPTQWTWVWVGSGSCDGQGGLARCGSWVHKESDMTEQLNWTELNWYYIMLDDHFHILVYLAKSYSWKIPF